MSNIGGVACSACWVGCCSEGKVTLSGMGGERFSGSGCDVVRVGVVSSAWMSGDSCLSIVAADRIEEVAVFDDMVVPVITSVAFSVGPGVLVVLV